MINDSVALQSVLCCLRNGAQPNLKSITLHRSTRRIFHPGLDYSKLHPEDDSMENV